MNLFLMSFLENEFNQSGVTSFVAAHVGLTEQELNSREHVGICRCFLGLFPGQNIARRNAQTACEIRSGPTHTKSQGAKVHCVFHTELPLSKTEHVTYHSQYIGCHRASFKWSKYSILTNLFAQVSFFQGHAESGGKTCVRTILQGRQKPSHSRQLDLNGPAPVFR